MHLLNVKTRKLEAFYHGAIPKYAILSHTWGHNEPTFDDLQNVTKRWRLRIGSGKISRCYAQAASDGFDYVWIDNCCIDKRSSAELSEAINSMFKWYAEAAVCYVYLVDVCPAARQRASGAKSAWMLSLDPAQLGDLKKARWFTRGWTLQELLAPSLLKFYDSAWNLIGYSSRIDVDDTTNGQAWEVPRLNPLLADITAIPMKYLQEEALDQASVAERMSWAAGRQTTRLEDMAYCLLGLFSVNMPMLYGEGPGAFLRLQEEIMRKYDDHSIFTWGLGSHTAGVDGECCMAKSPADFKLSCSVTMRSPEDEASNHYEPTNAGIHIQLPLVQLRSGEYLARLNCTVDSGQVDVLLEDKYLSLILIQSRDRKNVFYRRTVIPPTPVSLRFFEHAVRQSIYLTPAPYVTIRDMRNGPLFVSAGCANVFKVRFTYPGVLDVDEGVYSLITDLWKHLRDGNGIFLDCVSVGGKEFAIRVLFEMKKDDIDGGGIGIESASLSISRRRDVSSMVELMMLPKTGEVLDLGWETDTVVDGYQIALEPTETNQWKIDIVL